MGDTLAINAFRALALIICHPHQRNRVDEELVAVGGPLSGAAVAGMDYLGACIQEAIRPWPTTPMPSREAVTEVDWDGAPVPAGTQVLIVNVFHRRDRKSHEFAARFAPEAWRAGWGRIGRSIT